jgi:hypothetical protein
MHGFRALESLFGSNLLRSLRAWREVAVAFREAALRGSSVF